MAKRHSYSLFRADSIALSLGVNTAAMVLQRGLGLLRGVLLVWLMPTAEFGLFSVSLLVANLLLPLCSLGLYEGVARYTPQYEAAGSLRRFAVKGTGFIGLMGLITIAALFLAADSIGVALFSTAQLGGEGAATSPPAQAAALARAALLCVFTLILYHSMLGLLKGLRMFRALSVAELVTAVVFTVLALGLAGAGWGTARVLMLAYAASNVLTILVFAPGLCARLAQTEAEPPSPPIEPSIGPNEERPVWSTLLKYSVWAGGTVMLWQALVYYPTWHLLKVTDEATVGTLHAVRMITQFVQIVAVMLAQVVAATVNRTWEHEGREPAVAQLDRLTKLSFLALLGGAILLVIARSVMMRLLPGKVALGVAAYQPLLLFFFVLGAILLITIRLNLLEKPRLVFFAWLIGCAASLAACFAFLGSTSEPFTDGSEQALRIAAWASVCGVVTALLVLMVLVHRHGIGVGRPAMVLIAASIFIVAPPVVAGFALAAIAIVSLCTGLVLTKEDRAPIRRLLNR
ncbi:MAG: oligosaccharide flippase family protein [Phycisphaerales bacterium]|nr:MAG: oligosaccharide flippase family protein [Phycisphaerales bacterium]